MQFRKKPLRIEATQWFKNGDHPLDKCEELIATGLIPDFMPAGTKFMSEGKIVRYFRRPDVPASSVCQACGAVMHDHGWIDDARNGGAAHIVCPGDWIITGVNGEMYPCKPDIFDKTYEAV